MDVSENSSRLADASLLPLDNTPCVLNSSFPPLPSLKSLPFPSPPPPPQSSLTITYACTCTCKFSTIFSSALPPLPFISSFPQLLMWNAVLPHDILRGDIPLVLWVCMCIVHVFCGACTHSMFHKHAWCMWLRVLFMHHNYWGWPQYGYCIFGRSICCACISLCSLIGICVWVLSFFIQSCVLFFFKYGRYSFMLDFWCGLDSGNLSTESIG